MSTIAPFLYAQPGTLDEALSLFQEYGSHASLLAGGTDLLVRLQIGKAQPQIVIDLKRIAQLDASIHPEGSFLHIGALAVMAEIVEHPLIRRSFPALAEAANTVGSVQIRNRATLAGNICNASPAADTAPALLVYGAAVNIIGAGGRRQVPISEFFTGPGQTVLHIGELVESIHLPLPPEVSGSAFARLTRRRGVDLATINLCCLVKPSRVTLFAYGAVGPRPFLVSDPSGTLADPHADQNQKEAVLRQLIAHASPITDVRASLEYRQAMLLILSRRALDTALQRLHHPNNELNRQ